MKGFFVSLLIIHGAVFGQPKKALPHYLDLKPAVFSLSMVMMHDVVNPPAAARFYTYAMLSAYEIVSQNNAAVSSLSPLLKNYKVQNISVVHKNYNYKIAAVYAILETGKKMLPSGFLLEEDEKKYIAELKKNKIARSIIDSSIKVADFISSELVAYAKNDGYLSLSTKLRYTPSKAEGSWYPTPPSYMEAVEPNWKTIRPMLIDSCNQFLPLPPETFSTDSSSSFYKMAKEVYDVSKTVDSTKKVIAAFWDCNPFAVNTSGHMSIGFKKISPGGHWMNITGIAAKKAKLSFDNYVVVESMVSLVLFDAFISCWDEKYRSNRIRPETYINKYIDLKWQPLLQTPPFPEYTSGHSVISTAAAEVLTYFLGDNFSFTDDSEEIFRIPRRHFKSFRLAAEEAAISRLYGGIHFKDAIVNGQTEGKALGRHIVEKIKDAGFLPCSSSLRALSLK